MKRLLALLVALSLSLATAHQSLWNPGSSTPSSPYVIEEVEVSKAIFGELKEAKVAHFILSVPDDFSLDIGVFKGGDCEEAFSPELWIFKEGKATPTPFESLANFSGQRIEGEWSAYRGHGLVGFKGAAYRETLEAGTYSIVVYAPQGEGMYLLSLGGLEQWGGSEEGRAAIPRFNSCR